MTEYSLDGSGIKVPETLYMICYRTEASYGNYDIHLSSDLTGNSLIEEIRSNLGKELGCKFIIISISNLGRY